MKSSWIWIAAIYLVGLLAAAQLGKMPALMPGIERDIPLGLIAGGAVISLIELGGALLGRTAGSLSQAWGHARVMLGGIGLIALAGLGEGLAGSGPALVAWRVVESAGYLAVIVSAPVLIALSATPARRGTALALWSTFVPVGLMIGAAVSGALAEAFGWRAALLAWSGAAVFFLLALSSARQPRPPPPPQERAARAPRHRIWLLSLGFGCYTTFEVGMLAMLPGFLVAETGASLAWAGAVTGAASFLAIAGVFVAAWASRHGHASLWLMACGALVPAVLLFAVFRAGPDPALTAGIAIGLHGASGLFSGLAFALLPSLTAPDELSAANGLISQCGASGSLIGPPLYAACIAWGGWTAGAAIGALACVAGLGLLIGAVRESRFAP